MSPRNPEGLGLGYRIWYRFRYVLLQVLGPAQLSGSRSPIAQLRQERERRVEQARREGRTRD